MENVNERWKRFLKQKKSIKLNVGCGSKFKTDYMNIDNTVPVSLPDDISFIKADTRDFGFIADGAVDEILTEFLLEHFHPAEALEVLFQFWRILKPETGKLIVLVPDFEAVARTISSETRPHDPNGSIFGVMYEATMYLMSPYMSAKCADSESGHKSIWTPRFLCECLGMEGFKNIVMSNEGTNGWGLRAQAFKGYKSGEMD